MIITGVLSPIKKKNNNPKYPDLYPYRRTLAHIGRERTNDLRTSVTQLFNNPRLLPLTKRQRKLVTRNPGSLVAVAKGARLATDECQFQFRARRWNCPLFWDGYGTSVFGKILQRGEWTPGLLGKSVTYSVRRPLPSCTVS